MTLHAGPPLKFQLGDTVRIDDRAPLGHCRAPSFIRGQTGTVSRVHGPYLDPERLAYHQPGLPAQNVYKVRFRQTEIWPDYAGAAGDHLEVDVFENWLQPVAR